MSLKNRLRRLETASTGKGRFIVTQIYEGETLEQAREIEHPGIVIGPRDFAVNLRLNGWTRDGQLVADPACMEP